jgi:hypothetical protein
MKSLLKKLIIGTLVALAAAVLAVTLVAQPTGTRAETMHSEEATAAAVTVARVTTADFTETVLATARPAVPEPTRLPIAAE